MRCLATDVLVRETITLAYFKLNIKHFLCGLVLVVKKRFRRSKRVYFSLTESLSYSCAVQFFLLSLVSLKLWKQLLLRY